MEKNNYKLIVVFVGLPASGKSYIANYLTQYLSWLGYNINTFNCGHFRRKITGRKQCAQFFDNSNKENSKIRESFFHHTLFELNNYLKNLNGDIGILDASNTTKLRRKKIIKFFSLFRYKKKIIFLENITNYSSILKNNINFKKMSPDYIDISEETMKNDFNKRLEHYTRIYEDIEDDENIKYIKNYNCGKKVIFNDIHGEIETLILDYLINFKVNIKTIFISRHGQSLFNLENRIGGDPDITEKGFIYSKKLYDYISTKYKPEEIEIFTSNLKRTKNTANLFIKNNYNVCHKNLLNEIDGGICENMTYEQVKQTMPGLFSARKKNKFYFKYPEGESYYDLILRVKEFILELNKINKPILIISHNAIIRVLFSYFLSIKHDDIPYVDVPLHTLFCIKNDEYCYKKTEII
jgi:broad specificity phosphatase PhoE/predicted kinase